MKYAFLVALREYMENAKTKGFWIGLLLFPIILTVSLSAPKWLEKATPTRHFVIVDRSEAFAPQVKAALDQLHASDVTEAFFSYLEENRDESVRPDAGAVAEAIEVVMRELGADFPEGVIESMLAPILKQAEQSAPDIDTSSMAAIDPSKFASMLEDSEPQFGAIFTRPGVQAAFIRLLGVPADAPPFEEPRRRFKQVPLPEELEGVDDLARLADGLRPYVRGDKELSVEGESVGLFAAVLIPADIEATIQKQSQVLSNPASILESGPSSAQSVQYWATNLADTDLKKSIEREINREIRKKAYEAEQFDLQKVKRIQSMSAPFVLLNPKKKEGEEEVSLADQIRQWAPVGFVYLLWIGIFTISQMLLSNTIEEKSNRIIEVLLSSVTPGELMMGKLFGIAAVGLTMISAWLGTLVGILAWRAGPEAALATELFEVLQTSGLLPYFVLYFLLGYLIYSGLFLGIGSVCNTLKDAQNLMGPIMLIMIVPLITMMFIPKDPNGTLATVLSWIPIYTPFIMMNRAAADPPLFDVIGTLILLVASTILVLWLSSRVFRIGILRTGQPPKLMELLRWFRASA